MKARRSIPPPLIACVVPAAALVAPCVLAVITQCATRWHLVTQTSTTLPRPALLASTIAWAVGIGVLATLLAWPAAWLVARRGLRPWLLTPLLVPSYLAYHSLGLLRDPTTWLGRIIEHAATPQPNGPSLLLLPLLVGRVLAFVGLALWSWPIAAMVLGPALRSAEADVGDALRVDGAGAVARHWEFLKRARATVLRAVALIALVMLGSGVPLHLANAPTLAVVAWQEVMLHPGSPGVWLLTSPLLVIGALGAWLLSGAALRSETNLPPRARAAVASLLASRLLVGASTVLPLVLYVLFLRTWASVPAFLRVSGDAAAASAGTAALVGVAGGLVCAAFWYACSARTGAGVPTIIRASLGVLLFASLTPGILVGHAWAAFWAVSGVPDVLLDSPVPTVLAHATRFAGVAALAGCVLASVEPASTRDARAIDAGHSLRAWARTGLSWTTLAGVALGVACLSLHEVESSIVVQPPGLLSLPQTMLANLHFARQEETSAGAIVVIGAGLVAAWGTGCLLRTPSASEGPVLP